MARTSTLTKRKRQFTTRYAKQPMPPNCLGYESELPEIADKAMRPYRKSTGLPRGSVLLDMLVGMMELCDLDTRYGDFDEKLAIAYECYAEATDPDYWDKREAERARR